MSPPRLLVIVLAASLAIVASARTRGARAGTQSGVTVRTEQWPVLGLEVNELVLENGFRIVLVEDYRIPRVALPRTRHPPGHDHDRRPGRET